MARVDFEPKYTSDHAKYLELVLREIYAELVVIFQASLLKPIDNDIDTRLKIKDLIETLKQFGE